MVRVQYSPSVRERILINEEKPAGSYEVEFSTGLIHQTLPSGVYFYQLRAGAFIETKNRFC